MTRRVHIVEPGGRGGVFQHSIELTRFLHQAGATVLLHTAADAEVIAPDLPVCGCFSWDRTSRDQRVRRARTVTRIVARTLPHLLVQFGRTDVVHVQGLFGLTPEIIAVARRRGSTVVSSPHNTFVRDNSIGSGRSLRSVLAQSHRVLVYSHVDAPATGLPGERVGVVPLVQWTPPVKPELVAAWRESLGVTSQRLVVLAGQVRPDKNPELFVRAVASMTGWRGAVVGDDLGPGASIISLRDGLGANVATHFGYLTIDEFVAVVAAADVVAAPYRIASQSGVLAVAAALGIPTAATPTGGLAELATAVATDATPEAFGNAIAEAHRVGARPYLSQDVADLYQREYEIAVRTHRGAAS